MNYPWFELYRAALLEVDTSKLPERVENARRAINQRTKTGTLSSDESEAITDALNVLFVLGYGPKADSAIA